MELNSETKYEYIEKPIDTIRDEDNNLISVTSSDSILNDSTQFVQVEKRNYSYPITNDVIDYDFTEFSIVEENTNDKIVSFFNSYNELKDFIKIPGQTESHEYLFNSSKLYLGKDNLIVVDNDEYSNLIVENENLKDDLRVKDEVCDAEKEASNRELTALYTTVNSIKDGAASIIDDSILPVVGENLQFKYSILSLKSIIGQSIDYLLRNKSNLAIRKRSINDYDIKDVSTKILNNTITYNYISDPNYFKTVYDGILTNPDLVDLQEKITNLESIITNYENTIATMDEKIKELQNKLDECSSGTNGTSGSSGTSGNDITIKDKYNQIFDSMIYFLNNTLISKLTLWKNRTDPIDNNLVNSVFNFLETIALQQDELQYMLNGLDQKFNDSVKFQTLVYESQKFLEDVHYKINEDIYQRISTTSITVASFVEYINSIINFVNGFTDTLNSMGKL